MGLVAVQFGLGDFAVFVPQVSKETKAGDVSISGDGVAECSDVDFGNGSQNLVS